MRLGWFWRVGWFHMIPPCGDCKILHIIAWHKRHRHIRIQSLDHCEQSAHLNPLWLQWDWRCYLTPVASSLFSPCLFWFSGGIVLHFSVQRIETRNASDVFSSWRPLSMAALAEFSDVRCWDKNAFTDVTGDLGHGRIRNDHRSDYVYGHRSAVWASGFSPVGSDVRDEVWFQHLRSLKLVLSLRGRFGFVSWSPSKKNKVLVSHRLEQPWKSRPHFSLTQLKKVCFRVWTRFGLSLQRSGE